MSLSFDKNRTAGSHSGRGRCGRCESIRSSGAVKRGKKRKMKRVGHLMEKMLTKDNFIEAERLLGKNKRDNRKAQYIAENAERYGVRLLEKIQAGEFAWHKPRETVIVDSYKGKTRNLKIPCLEDQAAQLAWLNIAAPYIERRNYFYNCGSIPGAGQTRSVKALQKWLKNPRMKYGAITDIKKFYETCPHGVVRKGLERLFKDKAFIDFAMGFVASMSDSDIGLAIGYPSSHWLANVALMELDHEIKRQFPDVKMTRYMDDVAMVSTNFRHIKKAVRFMKLFIETLKMRLKKWSVFRIRGRGLRFLSYRFFNGYTLLAKKLMVRIASRIRKAAKCMNAHAVAGIVSYFGILKYCNSYNFRKTRIYPYINIYDCVRLISAESRRKNLEKCACN